MNETVHLFIFTLNKELEICTKITRTPKRKHTLKPWITKGILRCMRNRDKSSEYNKYPRNKNLMLTR